MNRQREARAAVDHWDEFGRGYKDGEMIVCICGATYPLRGDHYCPADEPEHPCSMCRGEGALGTGLSDSFVDSSDAMPCPCCEGSGEDPIAP